MKVEELMIGDWVLFCGDKYKIHKEDYSGNYEFEPIQLTDEILKKNGFNKTDSWGNVFSITEQLELVYSGMYSMHQYEIMGTDNSISACTGIYIDYVHELQHILKQCKNKKDIII